MLVKKWAITILKEWQLICIAIMILINGALILKVTEIKAENQIWKNKITLSLSDQIAILEHNLEGIDLSKDIEDLKKYNLQACRLFDEAKGYILLYILRGSSCDRCLSAEMRLLQIQRPLIERSRINIIVILTDIDQYQYVSFINLFYIRELSARDELNVLAKRFSHILSPIILLLNHDKHIIAASISDYRDEGKNIRFFEKVHSLIELDFGR